MVVGKYRERHFSVVVCGCVTVCAICCTSFVHIVQVPSYGTKYIVLGRKTVLWDAVAIFFKDVM